jgi:hypothetical protein
MCENIFVSFTEDKQPFCLHDLRAVIPVCHSAHKKFHTPGWFSSFALCPVSLRSSFSFLSTQAGIPLFSVSNAWGWNEDEAELLIYCVKAPHKQFAYITSRPLPRSCFSWMESLPESFLPFMWMRVAEFLALCFFFPFAPPFIKLHFQQKFC